MKAMAIDGDSLELADLLVPGGRIASTLGRPSDQLDPWPGGQP
jgi:hypothetical protein